MDLKAAVISNITWSAIDKWGAQALSFLIFTILARLLEPADFGLIGMALVFTSLANIFLEQGFSEALIQRRELDSEHIDTIFWVSVGMGVTLTLIGILSSPLIAFLFHEPKLGPVVSFLSLNFFLSGLGGTQQAILYRNMKFKSLSVRSLIGRIGAGIAGIGCAFLGYGVWSLVVQQLVASLVSVTLLWQMSAWRPGLHFSKQHFSELFSFSFSMFWHKIVNFIDMKSDNFVIGYFLGPVMLGYYSVGYRIYEVLSSLITGVVIPAVFPIFSRLQNDNAQLQAVFLRGTKLLSIVVFPLFLGVASLAPELITALFGGKWAPSIPVLQVLVFAGLLQAFLSLNGSLVIALGRPVDLLKIRIFASIVILIAFVISVRWGIVAVAVAYAAANFILIAPLHFRLTLRMTALNMRRYFGQFGVAAAASVLMVSAILGVKYLVVGWPSHYGQLLICSLTGMIVYMAASRLLWPGLFAQLNISSWRSS